VRCTVNEGLMVQLKTPRYGRLKSFWIALIDPVEDLSDQCGFGYRLPYPILFPKLLFPPSTSPKLALSLRSATDYLPQPLSPILESNRSTPACMTEPTLCGVDVGDVSALAQYGEESTSPETEKRPPNDDVTGTAKRRALMGNWPLPE